MTNHEYNYLNPEEDYVCTCTNQAYTRCCVTETAAGVCLGCTEMVDPNDLICPMCDNNQCADCHGFYED